MSNLLRQVKSLNLAAPCLKTVGSIGSQTRRRPQPRTSRATTAIYRQPK